MQTILLNLLMYFTLRKVHILDVPLQETRRMLLHKVKTIDLFVNDLDGDPILIEQTYSKRKNVR